MSRIEDFSQLTGVGRAGGRLGISHRGEIIPADLLNDIGNDSYQFSGKKQKRGFSLFNAVGNFFKGAVVDTVKGIFSTKGILAMGVSAGAVALMGPAALPLLLGVGLVTGGVQLAKGVGNAINRYRQGDMQGAEQAFEEIGSGAAGTGLSLFGLKKFYQSGILKTSTIAAEEGGATTNSVEASKSWGGTLKQLFKDVTGQTVVKEVNGVAVEGGKSLYGQLQETTGKNMSAIWQGAKGLYNRYKPVNQISDSVTVSEAAEGAAQSTATTAAAGETTAIPSKMSLLADKAKLGLGQLGTKVKGYFGQFKGMDLKTLGQAAVTQAKRGYQFARTGIGNFEAKYPGTVALAVNSANQKGYETSLEEQADEDQDTFSYS